MTGKISNRPQIQSFKLTAKKCLITIMQPAAGPQRSANLQHIEQHPIPSIEPKNPNIKEESEEKTAVIESDHQTFHQQLPLRSLSGEATADYAPPARGPNESNALNIYTTELPFLDEDEDDDDADEDEERPEIQVASSAAEEEAGPMQVNTHLEDDGFVAESPANQRDDEFVIVESPVYHQDPSPSPSPNSPLIGSPAREHEPPPEFIIYESEGSADNLDSGHHGEYVLVSQKRGRSRHASTEAEESEDPEDVSDDHNRETPNSKRIRTLSPSTDRLLSGRHIQHTWLMDQREAVYLLRRFSDDSSEEITTILNRHFSQEGTLPRDLRPDQVNAQWAEWSRAFWAEPKYDEEERWKERRASFAATARLCGIQLRPAASKNKPSVQTKGNRHQVHKADIRKWLQQCREPRLTMQAEPLTPAANANLMPSSPLQGRSTYHDNNGLLGFYQSAESQHAAPNHQESSSRRNPFEPLSQTPTGQVPQTNSAPSNVSPPSPATVVTSPYFFGNKKARPRLLFRVYHSGMPGENSPEGFRSGRRSQIPRDGMMDLPSTKRALLDEAMIHLMGNPYSCFVATTTSLVWTLYKGLERNCERETNYAIGRQQISLIDADKLPESTVFHAGSLIGAIRTDREEPSRKAAWANFRGRGYKAFCEWMIWGGIPDHAVLFDVPLEKLTTATSASQGAAAIADFLSLLHLSTRARMKSNLPNARKDFLSATNRVGHDLSSNGDGVALGQLARMFGFSISSDPGLLTAFVHYVCQGWVMRTEGREAIRDVAWGFLEEMERTGDFEMVGDDVAENVYKAVKEGLDMANAEIAKERRYY